MLFIEKEKDFFLNSMTGSILKQDHPNTKLEKGSNKHLFILTRTHSMQIFGEIPFIKPQNDT